VDILLLVPLIVVVFLLLLLTGRAQVAKGSNLATANGATLLTLAAVVGVLALALVVSLDVW
jgi:formate hydrogenlyase subunit 4